MPTVIKRPLNDNPGGEQAALAEERSTRRIVYAWFPNEPQKMYEFGGHAMGEAPEITKTEPAPRPVRTTKDGLNQTELVRVDDEVIQAMDYTLDLPQRLLTVQEMFIAAQRRNNLKARYAIIPTEDCPNNCDRYAILLGEEGRLGEIDDTTGPVAYDTEGDGGAVTRTGMLYTKGASIKYLGLDQGDYVYTGGGAIYALEVADRAECGQTKTFCPWQTAYAFNSDGTAKPAALKTTDKWATTSAPDVTATTAADIITSTVRYGNDRFVGISDAFRSASATAGQVFKSLGGSAAYASAGLTSTGINVLVVAGTRLHAFGTDGEWFYTDDGINWTTVSGTPFGEYDIYCAAYNPWTKRLYIGGENGKAFAIVNGDQVVTLSGFGTKILHSVHVLGPDHIVYGTSDGYLYEAYDQAQESASFSQTEQISSSSISFLGGDHWQGRLVIASGTKVYERGIATRGRVVELATATGNILAGSQGYSEHRRSPDYFLFGTDDGKLLEVTHCAPCS